MSIDPPVRYWSVVTRGLEAVAREEIEERIADAYNLDVGYRRVAFETSVDLRALFALRTVDDLFVDLGAWESIGRPRAALKLLGDRALDLDLRDAAAICRELREMDTPPSFSVTANFVGRRNYSTGEIKLAVAMSIEATHGWSYQARDADADLNVRVFLEHERAYLGVRLAGTPLHERPYKVATVAGSLKPTVAAAMIRLGRFPAGAALLDPLCGAGTIVLEAALMGYAARGGDHDTAALDAARQNRDAANVQVALDQWDAQALPLPAHSVDGVVCNLPWGQQAPVTGEIERFYTACLAEIARVARPNTRVVLLTGLQPLLRSAVEHTGLQLESELEISLSGQTPMIAVLQMLS